LPIELETPLKKCEGHILRNIAASEYVAIITAAIDPKLDEFGFIVPGLGDAGDRYFGTG